MPVLIKRKNNAQFPVMGDNTDLFTRLSEYINAFDSTWMKKIKPASREQIARLADVSQLKKWGKTFPEPYFVFLENMGTQDGGLLSETLGGTADIEEIIDLYNDFQHSVPQIFEAPYLIFFHQDTDPELSICLIGKDSDSILETDCGEVLKKAFDNFEKLLFQSAYGRFERFRHMIHFGGSPNNYKNAVRMNKTGDMAAEMDKIAEKYHLMKAWFSDFSHYIALGTDLSFNVTITAGTMGFVTGENQKIVRQLAADITCLIGAGIY